MSPVLIVYASANGDLWQQTLELDPGTTVQEAIQLSAFQAQYPDVDWRVSGLGIFGKQVKLSDVLKHGDRLEIYRSLAFDPKESRRRRALHRQRQKQNGEKRRGR
jgi:uncharacterized protein